MARMLGRVLFAYSAPRGAAAERSYSHGLEQLRSLLSDEVSAAARSSGASSSLAPVGDPAASGQPGRDCDSSSVVKELLRVFTRKVPGGLVPDDLVQGFMQAYTGLRGPQERLAFFQLLYDEMGLMVDEVRSAAALWDTALLRAAAAAAAASPAAAAAASAAAFSIGGAAGADNSAAAGAGAGSGTPPLRLRMGGPHDGAVYRAAERLGSATRPLYTMLFVPVSQAPDGMKFLVDMRADLLQLAAQQSEPALAAPLRAMADHLRQSLAEWFSVGLLHLQPISWRESPAALLWVVHPLHSWEELRRRLGPRRRVFAFTHPSMPGEPLVVLHTALLDRPASAMSEILGDPADPAAGPPYSTLAPAPYSPAASAAAPSAPPAAAVFYSISASQPGLGGIELGHFLIKRVAERLLAEHPSIRTLAPREHRGLEGEASGAEAAPEAPAGAAALEWLLEEDRWLRLLGEGGALRDRDQGDRGDGGSSGSSGGAQAGSAGGPGTEAVLQRLLLRLAARYLAVEKRRSFALCPVAHFHLRNGASLWRLNWRADTSTLGLGRSFGIMYDLPAVYDNNRRYLLQHEVQAHPTVLELLHGNGHAYVSPV
ncbi:Malonyl-CoA decarboxylase, mitochondrial [Tetrabaena socialis]|uniref:Malonyl-CoA decarboxylase, mitochondrial n=1 Tax=Tetrabaena socialis TaxID=47790 RepID=A0A2J7ZZ86_9CHLO|nr:Malonyl-CoA decarboxylase, mitochondrial [Tetrabaena socialis]|eukprot:PNH05568.1 Malonyl-CoA decarboxylase, mitochondrial [Tetrabaena socialis]